MRCSLPCKGAVFAHRCERPLAADMNESERRSRASPRSRLAWEAGSEGGAPAARSSGRVSRKVVLLVSLPARERTSVRTSMGSTAARPQPERAADEALSPRFGLGFALIAACTKNRYAGHGTSGVPWRSSASPRVLFAPSALGRGSGRGERVEPVVPFAGHFHVAVVERGSTSHLSLSGEFDIAGVGRVEDALDAVFRPPRPRQVLFDLRALTFLDAAGLRTILRANERARTAAVELRVVRPRGPANRVFTVTRAGAELRMVDDPAGIA